MAAKVNLGFDRKSRVTSEKKQEISPSNDNLVDALVPVNAPTPQKAPQRTKYIAFEDIYLNELNDGLSMDEIDQLAESISQVGLQQPLLVLQDENGKYRLLSGHRRYRAIEKLIKESKWTGKIECKETDLEDLHFNLSNATKELYVLLSGNINRDKTANDRLFEMKGWEKIYHELKTNKVETFTGLDGIEYELKKSREFISKMTGMSSGDLARLKKIDNNATQEVIDALNRGDISVNVASDIASLDKAEQNKKIYSSKSDTNIDANLTWKVFNSDIKTIKGKLKAGVNLTEEDLSDYLECIAKLQNILNKY